MVVLEGLDILEVLEVVAQMRNVMLESGNFIMEVGDFLLESGNCLRLTLDDVLLGVALLATGRRHAFAYAAFGGKFLVLARHVFCQGGIHLMAQADGDIGEFFVIHLGNERLIFGPRAMVTAKRQ